MTSPKISAMISAGKGMQPLGFDDMKENAEGGFMDVMKTVQNGVNARNAENPLPAPAKKTEGALVKEAAEASRKPGRPEKESGGRVKQEEKKPARTEREKPKPSADKTGDEESLNTAKDAAGEAASKVKAEIAEKLGISEEELEGIMEVMGITLMDLLNPQITPELVAEATGSDISAVLTDEALYSQVSEITTVQKEARTEVMEALQIPEEDFTEALEALKEAPPEPTEDAAPEEREAGPETKAEIQTQEKPKTAGENESGREIEIRAENSARDEVRTPAEANPERKPHTDATERKSGAEELPASGQSEKAEGSEETQARSEGSAMGQDPGRRQPARHAADPEPASFTQNLTQAVEHAADNMASLSQEGRAGSYVDPQRLLDQIESQVRVNFVNREETAMQMELNPASLGRLSIQLISRNGEVTAQFQAQNAQVRAALESHVAELKQSLEAQGVKIESVEVTVASHAFEQNLMQGQEQQQQEAGNAGRSRGGLRRINLNGGEEEEAAEGASEADRIARSMMRANGGSVDFTA
ncbi:MAG: flagellar hook-length control protein FliK [Lachnospiraceae bacterium]|nr:flagellar hook-length control protein FliK [Lachnospiraceae bacterium]